MPINIEGRQDGVGVIYNCHGDMTIDDFFQAGISFLAFPEGIKKWRYCIVDLTSVGAMHINSDDIRIVLEQKPKPGSGNAPNSNSASTSRSLPLPPSGAPSFLRRGEFISPVFRSPASSDPPQCAREKC